MRGAWVSQISTAPQGAVAGSPQVCPCSEQLEPSGGQGAPPSSVNGPPSLSATRHTGAPHPMYQCSPVLPPELDELPAPELDEPLPEPDELPPELEDPPHGPVTTRSHPCPQVSEEAHPNSGLWQAKPPPPSGYLHK